MGSVPRARAHGLELEYDTFGDPAAAPLLLIMGLAAQMISWEAPFCELLAGRGFYVIRFDNRDIGLSTWLDGAGLPDITAALTRQIRPPYTLDDMASDAVGLLDALGIARAHIMGASMGGFIAQLVALNHPERVLTLTSIMSGPGGDEATPPTVEGRAMLLLPPAETGPQRVAQSMQIRRILVGSGDPFDERVELARAQSAVDRSFHPAGGVRQLVAVLAAPGRLERLKGLRVPTLVIHGVDDVLVPVPNGRAVAQAVPGARLLELEGMGHDLPARVWPQVVGAIAELAQPAAVRPS